MSSLPGPSNMHPDDERFEQWCLDQLDEDDISDADENYAIESDTNTDSELSADENGIDINVTCRQPTPDLENLPEETATASYYYGREKTNKTKW